MDFEVYLISKKINAVAFGQAEPALFQSWKTEYAQMHANSFTVQKLNLINPIRRKYPLKAEAGAAENTLAPSAISSQTTASSPRVARPMIKPKPKTD